MAHGTPPVQPLVPCRRVGAGVRDAGRRPGQQVPDARQHHRSRPPAGCERKRGAKDQALGRSRGGLTTKIIDFDNSFFEAEPPSDPESFNFDVVYLAPEGYLFAAGEDVKVGKPLDVFALGVLFHQIFQGSVPGFVSGTKYNYLFEGLLSGDELKLGDAVPADMARLIASRCATRLEA